MTNPRPWFAATTLLVGLLAPTIAGAAALPVKIDAFEGEVVQISGTIHSGVMPGKALQSGVQVKTGRDGRVDFSLNGVPTLGLGNDADLLLHSMDQSVLRVRVARGALRVDTRVPSNATGKSRDVRLNAGDLRLRIANAEAWVEVSEQSGQVCLISGVVEAQQPTGAVRLDIAGQCLRQTGHSSQWTMVPIDLLEVRVAATGVQRTAAAAAAPPASKAPMQIKVLPLPGTLPEPVAAPPVVVLQQTPPTSTVKLKTVDPVEPPVVPDPPAPLPVAPAPAPTVAMKMAEPVEVPVVPAGPPPLPVMPAPAARVAMKPSGPVEVPVVPDPPAPLPVAPAPAGTFAIKDAAPVESPEIPDAPSPPPSPPPPPPPPAVAAAAPMDPVPSPPPLADAPPDVVAPAPEQPAPFKPRPAPVPLEAEKAPAPAASTFSEVALAPPASSTTTNAADDGRRWRVVLGSMPEKEKAEMEAERLNARGWAVEAREYHVGDRRGFRIGFGEFVARQDAQKALEEFLVQYPDAPAWLAKY